MPTFQKCPKEIESLANEILCEFETHTPLLDARVKIDLIFAFAAVDETTGEPTGNALNHHGVKALGIARKIALKDRAMGRGDCEVTLDGDWWKDANEAEARALLDHELHHFQVKMDKRGLVRDDLGRPVIVMRKHDYEFGWFKCIAARHGNTSMERMQAAQMMCDAGQYFWPEIAKQNA